MENLEIVAKLQEQAVNLDDRELGILLDPYRMKSGILMAFFDDTEEFYVHSSDPLLAKLAKRSAAHRDSRNGRNAVRDHITTHGYGCLVQNSNGTKWGFVHPNVNNTPRISFFDQYGFFGHSDCSSLDECAEVAFDYGMKAAAESDVMDKMFSALAA